jgi:Ca2+-binding EF-hand superfamily protein
LRIDQSITIEQDSNKLQIAKGKFENYIRTSNTNLRQLFLVLDTDSNKVIDQGEFKSKCRQMNMSLLDDEATVLFRAMDMNGTNSIRFHDLCEFFQ